MNAGRDDHGSMFFYNPIYVCYFDDFFYFKIFNKIPDFQVVIENFHNPGVV